MLKKQIAHQANGVLKELTIDKTDFSVLDLVAFHTTAREKNQPDDITWAKTLALELLKAFDVASATVEQIGELAQLARFQDQDIQFNVVKLLADGALKSTVLDYRMIDGLAHATRLSGKNREQNNLIRVAKEILSKLEGSHIETSVSMETTRMLVCFAMLVDAMVDVGVSSLEKEEIKNKLYLPLEALDSGPLVRLKNLVLKGEGGAPADVVYWAKYAKQGLARIGSSEHQLWMLGRKGIQIIVGVVNIAKGVKKLMSLEWPGDEFRAALTSFSEGVHRKDAAKDWYRYIRNFYQLASGIGDNLNHFKLLEVELNWIPSHPGQEMPDKDFIVLGVVETLKQVYLSTENMQIRSAIANRFYDFFSNKSTWGKVKILREYVLRTLMEMVKSGTGPLGEDPALATLNRSLAYAGAKKGPSQASRLTDMLVSERVIPVILPKNPLGWEVDPSRIVRSETPVLSKFFCPMGSTLMQAVLEKRHRQLEEAQARQRAHESHLLLIEADQRAKRDEERRIQSALRERAEETRRMQNEEKLRLDKIGMPAEEIRSQLVAHYKQPEFSQIDLSQVTGVATPISILDAYTQLAIVRENTYHDKELDRPDVAASVAGNSGIDKLIEQQQAAQKPKPKAALSYQDGLSWQDRIYAVKESLDISNVWNAPPTESTPESKSAPLEQAPNRVLVYGRAGIGKTTLLLHAIARWRQGQLWNDRFDFIFLVSMRRLSETKYSKPNVYLADIIADQCFPPPVSEEERRHLVKGIQTLLHSCPNRILVMADGWDESGHVSLEMKRRILGGRQQKHPAVMVCSRPNGVDRELKDSMDVEIENMGFSDNHIQAYVHLFFKLVGNEVGKAKSLMEFLKQNKVLGTLGHVPLMLQLICGLWNSDGVMAFGRDTRMTTIYGKILSEYVSRAKLDFSSGEQLINALGYLAFQALLDRGPIFCVRSEERLVLEQQYGLAFMKVLELGILRKLGDQAESSPLSEWYFIHLSFQEYLAARYLVSLSPAKQTDLICRAKFMPNFQLVLTFAAGILSLKMVQSQHSGNTLSVEAARSTLNQFFVDLRRAPVDYAGRYSTEQQLQCWAETRDSDGNPAALPVIPELIREAQLWFLGLKKGVDDSMVRRFGTALLPVMIPLLSDPHPEVMVRIAHTLQLIGEAGLVRPGQQAPLDWLLSKLSYHKEEVVAASLVALEKWPHFPISALDRILALQNHPSKKVQTILAKVCGAWVKDRRCIDYLLVALANTNSSICSAAAESLKAAAATRADIDKVCILVSNNDPDVSTQAAVVIVSWQNARLQQNQLLQRGTLKIFFRLATALVEAKQVGNELLGKLEEKAASNDPDSYKPAIDLLIKIGQKAVKVLAKLTGLTVEKRLCLVAALAELADIDSIALDRLKDYLYDTNPEVKLQACLALTKARQFHPALITELVNLLLQTEKNIFRGAQQSLVQIGPLPLVISKLLELCNATSPLIRCKAIKVLGLLGETNNQVIGKLRILVRDPNDRVQIAAISALASLQREDPTAAVVQLLTILKTDHEEQIKIKAIKAMTLLQKHDAVIGGLKLLLGLDNLGLQLRLFNRLTEFGEQLPEVLVTILKKLMEGYQRFNTQSQAGILGSVAEMQRAQREASVTRAAASVMKGLMNHLVGSAVFSNQFRQMLKLLETYQELDPRIIRELATLFTKPEVQVGLQRVATKELVSLAKVHPVIVQEMLQMAKKASQADFENAAAPVGQLDKKTVRVMVLRRLATRVPLSLLLQHYKTSGDESVIPIIELSARVSGVPIYSQNSTLFYQENQRVESLKFSEFEAKEFNKLISTLERLRNTRWTPRHACTVM